MRNFLVAFFVAVVATSAVQAELKSVAILFRHGERTNSLSMPKYGDTALQRELGAGELTLRGSQQMYDLGVTLSHQYKGLFPKSGFFRTSNMKITSSSANRCIASLTSFMAGFMPPPAADKTLPIRWQTFPFAVDNEGRILTVRNEVCPKYLAEFVAQLAAADSDPMVRSWMAEDKPLLDKLGLFMGKPLTTYYDVFVAAEVIRTEKFLDPSTPAWLLEAYEQLKRYFIHYTDMAHHSELMKTVRGGPLITQVVDNMNAVWTNNSTGRNVLLFSAHDLTVVSLATVLGIQAQVPAISNYADAVAIELHQSGANEPEVQVHYIITTVGRKQDILAKVPNCGAPCRLSTFSGLMSRYLVRDLDAICRL